MRKPEAARAKIGEATGRIDDGRAALTHERADRHRQRVHREVARRQVALERRRAKISDVDAPGAQDDARRAPLVVQRHERATRTLGDSPGQRQPAAWHREIEIDTVAADAAQDSIAYGTAHEHGVLASRADGDP